MKAPVKPPPRMTTLHLLAYGTCIEFAAAAAAAADADEDGADGEGGEEDTVGAKIFGPGPSEIELAVRNKDIPLSLSI